MLSKVIVQFYALFLEIAIWIILAVSFFAGLKFNGFFGGLFALFMTFIFSVVSFGAFLTLVDIRKSVKAIENNQRLSD